MSSEDFDMIFYKVAWYGHTVKTQKNDSPYIISDMITNDVIIFAVRHKGKRELYFRLENCDTDNQSPQSSFSSLFSGTEPKMIRLSWD